MSRSSRRVTTVAHANIALAKYWGKADVERNLPAVPSLSLTLDGLRTRTTVEPSATAVEDTVLLDGKPASGRALTRVVRLLSDVRALAGTALHARVETRNDFPTAAGLASSASGFAALALAAVESVGLELPPAEIGALARRASASAARSLYGGFVLLPAGGRYAQPLAPASHWPLSMLVAVVQTGPKKIGSTLGMSLTAATSPYYPAWLEHAPALFAEVRDAVLERDVDRLGPAMEQSALCMHASMLAARPALTYFCPTTWALLQAVRDLREAGVPAYYTIDAGPHVKVLTLPEHEARVGEALRAVAGVVSVIACHPGPDAHVAQDESEA